MKMSILSDAEIRELSEGDSPLIEDALDFDVQLQPAGFDVTTKKITRLTGIARVGGPYRSQVAAEEELDLDGRFYRLTPGSYLIYLNEYTRFPVDVVGFAYARSTLFRCGGSISSGVWDSGFHGRGRLGLQVSGVSVLEIEKDAPIAQLVFHRTKGARNGFGFNEFYRE